MRKNQEFSNERTESENGSDLLGGHMTLSFWGTKIQIQILFLFLQDPAHLSTVFSKIFNHLPPNLYHLLSLKVRCVIFIAVSFILESKSDCPKPSLHLCQTLHHIVTVHLSKFPVTSQRFLHFQILFPSHTLKLVIFQSTQHEVLATPETLKVIFLYLKSSPSIWMPSFS